MHTLRTRSARARPRAPNAATLLHGGIAATPPPVPWSWKVWRRGQWWARMEKHHMPHTSTLPLLLCSSLPFQGARGNNGPVEEGISEATAWICYLRQQPQFTSLKASLECEHQHMNSQDRSGPSRCHMGLDRAASATTGAPTAHPPDPSWGPGMLHASVGPPELYCSPRKALPKCWIPKIQ